MSIMTKEDLRNQFNKEMGLSHHTEDFIVTYITWLENKLTQSQSDFSGYCKQETNGKGRCKELCNRPECGY